MREHLPQILYSCALATLCVPANAQTTLRAWRGPTTGDQLGASIANIGDVDLDGVADLALGMPGDDTNALDSGAVRLVSGATGRILRTHYGQGQLNRFGTRVTRIGDVDGDGRPEYVASEVGSAPTYAVTVRVLSTLTGATLWTFPPPAQEAVGGAIVSVGDVNADGVSDLAVGSSSNPRVRILSGTSGAVLFVVDGPPAFYYFGYSISPAGDLDQDGRDDFWTAPVENFFSYTPTQHVQARSGLDGHVLFEIIPPLVFGEFGPMTVVGGNDLNGDSIPDVIVSARDGGGQYHGAGHVYAYSGANSSLLWSRVGANNAVSLGIWMFDVGDVDGDGRADVAASDSGYYAASLMLLSGTTGASIGSVLPPGGDRVTDLCRAGDVDGDGRADFAIGGNSLTVAGSMNIFGPGEVQVRTHASVALKADRFDVVHGAGGAQVLTLDFGATFANRPYRLLGSKTGTTPGIPTSVGTIPLFLDAYCASILTGTAGILPLPDRGFLDANGRATATFSLPPGNNTFVPGNTVRHAAVVLNPLTRAIAAFSRAVPLCIVDDPCAAGAGATDDCDANGVRDSCQIHAPGGADCNQNGRPDNCDLAQGLDVDCDVNGVPDHCQLDCNLNQRADTCDIAGGTSADCNLDGVPDECTPVSADVNQNDVPDICEATVRYVDDDAPNDPGPGSPSVSDPLADGTKAHPFDSLTRALAVSTPWDEIVVEDGYYTGPENRNMTAISRVWKIRSRNGPALCVFDVQHQGSLLLSGPWSNTFAFELNGITIQNFGHATESSHNGIYVNTNGSTVIRNCRFLDGLGSSSRGINVSNTPLGTLRVERCVFARNAGADFLVSSHPGSVLFRNCLILHDASTTSLWIASTTVAFEHCTLVGTAPSNPAFISLQGSSAAGIATFKNCVLRANSNLFGVSSSPGYVGMEYTNVQGGAAVLSGLGTPGPGIFDAPPGFVHAAGGDYHLAVGSPCIDTGDPLFVPTPHERDGDGEARVLHGRTDLGWDEVP